MFLIACSFVVPGFTKYCDDNTPILLDEKVTLVLTASPTTSGFIGYILVDLDFCMLPSSSASIHPESHPEMMIINNNMIIFVLIILVNNIKIAINFIHTS